MTAETWTALATVVIAGFTIVLAAVGGVQAWLTRQTINLARDEFEFNKQAFRGGMEATIAQIELAREEFSVTHRPKIIVRNFQSGMQSLVDLPLGKEFIPLFIGQNIGDTPGRVVEIKSGMIVLKTGQKLPTNLSFAFKEVFDVKLLSGMRELFPVNGGRVPTEDELFDIFADTGRLCFLGTVAYTDEIGTQRETGFCRRYIHAEDRWETIESEYEYAY